MQTALFSETLDNSETEDISCRILMFVEVLYPGTDGGNNTYMEHTPPRSCCSLESSKLNSDLCTLIFCGALTEYSISLTGKYKCESQ